MYTDVFDWSLQDDQVDTKANHLEKEKCRGLFHLLIAVVAKCQIFLKIESENAADNKSEHLWGQIVDMHDVREEPQEKEVDQRRETSSYCIPYQSGIMSYIFASL